MNEDEDEDVDEDKNKDEDEEDEDEVLLQVSWCLLVNVILLNVNECKGV